MPTYQYSCNDCGHFFEVFQSFTDDSLSVCPECGGALRKVFNAVGVVFKGSGFYRNDSRASAASGAPASSGAAASGPGSSKSKGDTASSATTGDAATPAPKPTSDAKSA